MTERDRKTLLRKASWARFKRSMQIAGHEMSDETHERVERDYEELGYRQMFDDASARAEKEGRCVSVVLKEMRAELRAKGEWPPTR